MRALTAAEIIQVWELGQSRPGWYRAMLLLAPALPDFTPDEVAAFSVGHRNALLFGLREAMIGSSMDAFIECPKCKEPLEFGLEVAEFCDGFVPEPTGKSYTLESHGFTLTYRLLDSTDLAAGALKGDLGESRSTLIERCLIEVSREGRVVEPGTLEKPVIGALADALSERDPLADKRLPLQCAACEHTWLASFDIVAYFWTEVERLAERLLEDVHLLAKAYGWRQSDILMMSPVRRRHFLKTIA